MGNKVKDTTQKVAKASFIGSFDPALAAVSHVKATKEVKSDYKKAAEEKADRRNAELQQENKRLEKELDIAQRKPKRSGLASLMGGDSQSDTLG